MCFDFLLKSFFFLQRFLNEPEKDKERCNREIEAYQKTKVFKLFKSQKEKKMMGRGHFNPRPHSSTRFIHCHSFPFNNNFSSIMSTSIHFHPFQPIFVYFHQFHPCSFTFIHFHPITFSSIHLQPFYPFPTIATHFHLFPSISSLFINFHSFQSNCSFRQSISIHAIHIHQFPSTSSPCNYYHFTHELGFESCKNVCLGTDHCFVFFKKWKLKLVP